MPSKGYGIVFSSQANSSKASRDGPRDPDVIAGQQFGCEFLERFPLARAGNALHDDTTADDNTQGD